MEAFDQFSRWKCPKCGEPGIDSWNKGIYDGINWEDDDNPPLPHILGMECTECDWPLVVRYDQAQQSPVVICGPVAFEAGARCYDYEAAAMTAIEADRAAGQELHPAGAAHRDKDWRGGCMALVDPPELPHEPA